MSGSFTRRLRTAMRLLGRKKRSSGPGASGSNGETSAMLPVNARCLMRRAPILLGWPGVVGIGLLVGCATFYFSTIQEAQAKLVTTRLSALALQERLRLTGARQEESGQHTPEEQVAQFYRQFPRNGDLPRCMEKIFASAQKQGIGLAEGEYKVMRDKDGGLVRFHMTFPVKGDYPSIRKYLTSLTTDIPTLSLQQVKFKRQKVGDVTVDANINLVLFLLEEKS